MNKWSKEIAGEIIAAGFRSMSRKYHPDVGGTHEQMLVLGATKDFLEKLLNGRSTSGFQQESTFKEEPKREKKWHYTSGPQQAKPEDSPLIERYDSDPDYFMIPDGEVLKVTEKAVQFKACGLKGMVTFWLPKSQLHEDTPYGDPGEHIAVIFTRWIAVQKGWIK